MNLADRRKEPRYVVVGIDAVLNGTPCTIVDISPSAVRLLRPNDASAESAAEIVFSVKAQGRYRRRSFRVAGNLVRSTELELIYSYPLPCRQWESLLRVHDTFVQTQLTPL